jgi:surfeit locus 1 family protein
MTGVRLRLAGKLLLRFRHFRLPWRSGRLQFNAGFWPTVATALLIPVLAGLGLWQLDRAASKLRVQAEYDRRQESPPTRLRSRLEAPETLRYRRVAVRGRYQPEYQILLDNRVHRGQAGYHVLTPLRIEDGNVRVLVNRGWVALGPDRAQLPRIETPETVVEVEGVATVPQTGGFRLGGARPAGAGWQPVWQYLDSAEYARHAPFPVQPVVILLDPVSPAGGFVRHWVRLDAGISTHHGYAFTWFALAVALAAIYILVNTRTRDNA